MRLFLIIYIGLYGGLHVYAGWHLARAFPLLVRYWLLTLPTLLLLMLLPLLLHFVDGMVPFGLLRVMAFVGYLWMFLIFWFFCITLSVHAWNWLVYPLRLVWSSARELSVAPRAQVMTALALIAILVPVGFWSATRIELKTVHIVSKRVPDIGRPLRIVQVSDLHIGRTAWTRILATAHRRIEEADADLLVSTGDLIDAVDPEVVPAATFLRDIRPPLGKFAVTGNHEAYPGLQASVELMQLSGFQVLRNEMASALPGLEIGGVDDPAVAHVAGEMPDERRVLQQFSPDAFRILLKHRPTVTLEAKTRCDLQLSGHTHNGQIFPFGLIVRIFYPHPHSRLISFSEGLQLYVSSGTGSWGLPLRFLARPEVTLFILQNPAGDDD